MVLDMSEMKIHGGEAVVESLVDHKVKTVYGLPGTHILDIYDHLRDERGIRHVLVMHEANASFMADAHGRLTGNPGVCLVTAGPGATNALTGIAQAYTEASPVVQITGHSGTRQKIQPDHGVDDWDFLLKIYQPVTKWSSRVERVEDICPMLSKAFAIATSDRPGPVHLEIPKYILEASGNCSDSGLDSKTEPRDISHSVERVAEILKSASSPMIAVGKGVLREFCSDQVIRLAKILGAPIITLPSSIGAIPYECPLYLGYDLGEYGARWMVHPMIKSVVKKADAILTLGFDVGERLRLFGEKSGVIIHVHARDVSIWNQEKPISGKPRINVEAGIEHFVKSLKKKIGHKNVNVKTIENKISQIKEKIHDDISKSIVRGNHPIHPGEIGLELRRILDDDAIVTIDIGNSSEWMKVCYRARKSNTILTPGRFGSMGFSLPAAIAAKINFPSRQVVAVMGDGGFLMSHMEFATIVKYKLGIIVVVESDRRYGMIWHIQRSRFRRRTFATEIETPDFAQYATAFGATGIEVENPDELKKGLEEAVSEKGPVLVAINTEYKFPSYIPTKFARSLRKIKYLGV